MRARQVLEHLPLDAAERLAPSARPARRRTGRRARTSCSVIASCGPVPATASRSTPSSCASRAHERRRAHLRPRRGPAAVCSGASRCLRRHVCGAAPSPPITTSTVPTGTTSPSATRIRETVPAAGEGISTVVLSVAISTSGSSSAISCPSATSQRAISPSVSPSPRSGSLNSTTSAYRAEYGVERPSPVDDLRHAAGRPRRSRRRALRRANAVLASIRSSIVFGACAAGRDPCRAEGNCQLEQFARSRHAQLEVARHRV